MSLIDRFASMRAGGKKPNLQSKTATPTASGIVVVPDSGYDGLSEVTVSGDADLIADNIRKNVTIFGVTGDVPTESEILDYYFTRIASDSKYKYNELQKKNPTIDTSSLTTMESMFENAGITTLDFTGMLTPSVTDMSKLCKNATISAFIKGDISTSLVTTFSEMFSGCTNLTMIDLSNLGTANVTDMSYMFNGCSSLASINLANFDTSGVTDMSYMFNGCSSLQVLNLKGFDFSNVTGTTDMFASVPANCAITVSSDDAKNFILSLRSDFTNITVVSDIYVGASSNGIFISRNSISWTKVSSTSRDRVKLLNGVFFATAYGYTYMYSYDGVTWNTASQQMSDITFDGTNYIGVYGSTIYSSADGITWTQVSSTLPFSDARGGITSDLNGKLCVAGYNYGVAVSSDGGLTWTQYNIGQFLGGLSVLNGQFFVYAKSNNVWYEFKFDGTTWVQVMNLSNIGMVSSGGYGCYANNTYVISCGSARKIIRSTDGSSFTAVNVGNQSASSGGLGGITFNGTQFCVFEALTSQRQIQKSTDGLTWVSSALSYSQAFDVSSMVFKPAE